MELTDVLQFYGSKCITQIKEVLTTYGLRDSNLYYSVKFRIEGKELIFDFPNYTQYAEYGRGPGGMPPKRPVEDWMRRHGIDLKYSYPIRKSIQLKGTGVVSKDPGPTGKARTQDFTIQTIPFTNIELLYEDLRKYAIENIEEDFRNLNINIKNY